MIPLSQIIRRTPRPVPLTSLHYFFFQVTNASGDSSQPVGRSSFFTTDNFNMFSWYVE